MGMRINTNVEAFNAQRNLAATAATYAKSVEKLSSGLRINRAGDDAAGLSISEKLRAQTNGLAQAQRNAQDGISMIQTAEGALNETHSVLQRMRELLVQAHNGTLSTDDQSAINAELTQLGSEVDRIATQTKFNGTAVLNTAGSVTLQIGANTGETLGVTLQKMDATTLGVNAVDSTTAISTIDTAITTVSAQRGTFGAVQNRLEHTIANLGVAQENTMAAESRIRDVDMAAEMVNFTKTGILQQAGQAILAQANQGGQGVLSLLRG